MITREGHILFYARWISIIFMTLMSMLSYSNVKNTRAHYVTLQEPLREYILRYSEYNIKYKGDENFQCKNDNM